MFKKNLFNLAVVLIFVLGLFSPSTNQIVQAQEHQVENTQSDESEVPTNRIIIKYKEGTDASFMPALEPQMQRISEASNWSLEYVREMSDDAHVLELPERLSVEQVEAIAAQLESLPEVEYAEADRIYQHTVEPNDTLYEANQWYLDEAWGINAPTAWDIETGSTNVVIAVLDTGITAHGDIVNRLLPGYDFIGQDFWNSAWVNYTANDGDGRDNDPSDPGNWITVNENNGSEKDNFFLNCGVSNSSWHGTHVAGIIGAETNNSAGIAGVDWNAGILPVRVLGKCGGYTSDIIDGMRWAAGLTVTGVPANANPAHIINLSLGGLGSCSTTEQNAVTEILNAGTVIVAAAGNGNVDVNGFSPANCTGVIAVAATDDNGEKATYSNFGSGVDISAPGDDILSLINTGLQGPVAEDYGYKSGTSMAAPQVSGVLGLMFAINPDLTPAQALIMLQRSAKAFPDGGTCTTTNCGAGILDAGAAVALTELPDLIITNVTLNPAEPVSGQPFDMLITVKNQGGSTTSGIIYPGETWVDVDPRTLPDNDLDGCPDPTSAYSRGDDNYSYAPGDTRILSVNIDNPPLSGAHQLWVYVDGTCLEAESIEDNNVMGPIAVGGANIDVTIGGTLQGSYFLPMKGSKRVNYAGVDSGPVVVESTDNTEIIAALRDAYFVNGQLESFVQLMGLPEESLSTTYYFPAYNNVTLDGQLRFANVGNSATTVTVTIAGIERGTYNLAPGEAKRVNYVGVDAGPVVVESSGGVPIIAALRDAYYVDGKLESFAQLMGLPEENLSTSYYFPAYNNVTLDGQLRFGNVGNATTTVTVTIAGVVRGTYDLDPSEAVRVTYALDAGPVVVESSGGVPIIAALRDAYFVDGKLVSFVQLMGLPEEQLSTIYNFPAYNNVTLDGQLRFGNVGNSATTVTVTIAGIERGTYNLNPSQAVRVNYAGVDAGPVVIQSSGGVPIIAALRDAYFVLGKVESFAQLMGLPEELLSSTYYFPAYNNVTLDGQLRFGVP